MNIIMASMKPGNTKLVRLAEVEKHFQVENALYAKVEASNPSGSIKDRAVYQMLLDYRAEGKLKEGTTIVEATSGNTGIALGYYSKVFNYKLIIVMPASMSQQRRNMIQSYGAELCLISGGMAQCEEHAKELVKQIPNSFEFKQFDNPSNPKAHYLTTGPEITTDLPKVNMFFAGIGTGGTISGTGKYLKEKGDVKVIGVEPFESPLLTKGVAGGHLIQGIGANFIPNTYDKNVVDDIVDVKGEEAIKMAKFLRNTGDFDVGYSSGAALLGAINYLKDNGIKGKNVVIIFPDKGNRYSW